MQLMLAAALAATIDFTAAQRALDELAQMCAADRARTWGTTVCGPVILVDPASREALVSDGSGERVTLPESLPIANTASDWNGKRWTMVMLPLPPDPIARRVLLAHESFHRIQPQLDLSMSEQPNAHLDSADGRYWLRLEWRALARALASSGEERRDAIADALQFRAKRRAVAANAASQERALEINEGLAEYTGTRLAVPVVDERVPLLLRKIERAEHADTLVRSFAYTSGPAWGALIEARVPMWTRKVKRTDDLGDLARVAWKIERGPAEARTGKYDGAIVRAEEDTRERTMIEQRAAMRTRYIEGPLLIIPLHAMQMVFNPNGVRPLEGQGTVYQAITITDDWGKLVVTGGALITSDFKRIIVPASGDGYALTLNEGWRKVAGARNGDWVVERRSAQ